MMPSRPEVHLGDKPTITTTFTVGLTPTSPATVTARYLKPDGTQSTLVPVEEEEGVWVTTLPTVDQAGMWWWWVAGTAGVIAADQGWFVVTGTPISTAP